MKIVDIRPATVTVPLEAPLRHANGCHWGRFVRTIIEVETDNGLVGLGEMGGGGESAEAVFRSLKSYLAGHDPARLEEMRFRVANPTASLYNNRTQVLAALEFACLDILGQAWGVPVHAILGGKLRDRVPFASYCFFRYADARTGTGEVRTVDQVVANARALKERFGFATHKMKGGVFPPDYELAAYRALAETFRDIHGNQQRDHDIDERNHHQQEPPARASRDLQQDIGVIERDDGGPAGLPGLFEDLPHSDDEDHRDGEEKQHHRSGECHQSAADSPAGGIILQQQAWNRRHACTLQCKTGTYVPRLKSIHPNPFRRQVF